MGKRIELEFEGRTQPVSAWARETGIRIDVLLSRLRNGWEAKDTLTTPIGVARAEKPYTYKGGRLIEYNGKKQTVVEWSKETGLPVSVIHGRLSLGWSITEILTKPVRAANPHGSGYKRPSMQSYMHPHRRVGYRPKPLDGCCELCGKPSKLHADHDHETDKFRGWLCFQCNTGLEKLGDTVAGLRAALAYLTR